MRVEGVVGDWRALRRLPVRYRASRRGRKSAVEEEVKR